MSQKRGQRGLEEERVKKTCTRDRQKKPVPNKLSLRAYSEKIPESQYFKENNCEVQWKSRLHPRLMMAHARQSVIKWICHLSLPHKGIYFMFLLPNQGNHMLKTAERTQSLLQSQVPENRS